MLLSGAIDKGQCEKVVKDYFQEEGSYHADSDSENESDDVNKSDSTQRAKALECLLLGINGIVPYGIVRCSRPYGGTS